MSHNEESLDEFYSYEIIQLKSPKKWFDKTSNTRVYMKDSANQVKKDIQHTLRGFLLKSEERRDRFMLREILRKNIWKYKREDFEL